MEEGRYGTVVSGGRKSAFSKATFVANKEDLEPESPKTNQPSPGTEDEHGNNVGRRCRGWESNRGALSIRYRSTTLTSGVSWWGMIV